MPPELIITPAQRNEDDPSDGDDEDDENAPQVNARSFVAELPPLIGSAAAARNSDGHSGSSKKRGHVSVRKSVVPALR